jgi:hypothetical protein
MPVRTHNTAVAMGSANEMARNQERLTTCDLATFTRWLDEIEQQPPWRSKADKEMDYLDGNQLDAEVLRKQQELGISPALEPIIGPTMEIVFGLEAKTRTDWKVISDAADESADEVAEALNYKLNQAERKSKADDACGDAYKTQASVGIGWVEVSKEKDPFKFPYRCRVVHRNEIWWDFLSVEKDLSDARYLIRRRWVDVDQVALMFPAKSEMLRMVGKGWQGIDIEGMAFTDGGQSTGLAMSWNDERGWSVEEQQWRDPLIGRLCLYEVWYRVWDRALVMRMPDGRVIEFDRKNDLHIAAITIGKAKLIEAVVSNVRLAWFCGPHRLHDGPSPFKHNHYPYVPFWGAREDRTNVPYGRIRGMMYLQDEINARSSKMQWLLTAKTTIRTDGAVKYSDQDFQQMAARPDADFILDREHMQLAGSRFEIKSDYELNAQQYQRLQDAREAVGRSSGISDAYRGEAKDNQSGVALQTLVEQSAQGLAKINSNFAMSRAMVGELLLSLIIEDTQAEERVVIEGDSIKEDKIITLNQPFVDEDGVERRSNDVQRALLKVSTEDVPSSPSYRVQQLHSLTEAFKTMPEQYQIVALPHLVALLNIPYKREILDAIREQAKAPNPETEAKNRELDIKERLAEAQIEKLVTEIVNKRIEAIYSGTQAGVQIASMPGVAPIADQVLLSAGFNDQDAPPIVGGPAVGAMGGGEMQGDVAPGVVENTSPMFPPRVQEPDLQGPEMEGGAVPGNPGVGMNEGIEEMGPQI